MIDVHRRWATEKNERMRIIPEVTHTDDCGFSAVYQQKKEYGEVCKMNPSSRGSVEESFTLHNLAESLCGVCV